MSCKHKCKCKKKPVLVLVRYGDYPLEQVYEYPDYKFEYMSIDLNDPVFPELVKKRLKCMCKKYGCKPDVVSAIFNLTAELRLAQCLQFMTRFYTSNMDNSSLRQSLGDQLQSFYVKMREEWYMPRADWFFDLGYPNVEIPENLNDSIMAQIVLATQYGATITKETGPWPNPEETLRVAAGLDVPFVNGINIVSGVLANPEFKGASFIDIKNSSKIRLLNGSMVNGATRMIPGEMSDKNLIFAEIAGYKVDYDGTLRSRRVGVALESFAYNQTRNPGP